MNGLDNFASSCAKGELYKFLVQYIRKVHPDKDTKKDLKNNEGL